MFKLEIDLSLCFVPPMEKQGGGICITRELELPFPPSEDLRLTGVVFDGTPCPEGYKMQELTWDMDRKVFLGRTSSIFQCFPFKEIFLELCDWIERGWCLGSYREKYEKLDGRGRRSSRKPISCEWEYEDEDTIEQWLRMKPKSRPESFNDFFKAIIREMALLHNNSSVAYAMHRTKMFFTEEELENNDASPAKKFKEAQEQFKKCPSVSSMIACKKLHAELRISNSL